MVRAGRTANTGVMSLQSVDISQLSEDSLWGSPEKVEIHHSTFHSLPGEWNSVSEPEEKVCS